MANEDAREPSSVTGRALGTIALVGALGGGGVLGHKALKKVVSGGKKLGKAIAQDGKSAFNSVKDAATKPVSDAVKEASVLQVTPKNVVPNKDPNVIIKNVADEVSQNARNRTVGAGTDSIANNAIFDKEMKSADNILESTGEWKESPILKSAPNMDTVKDVDMSKVQKKMGILQGSLNADKHIDNIVPGIKPPTGINPTLDMSKVTKRMNLGGLEDTINETVQGAPKANPILDRGHYNRGTPSLESISSPGGHIYTDNIDLGLKDPVLGIGPVANTGNTPVNVSPNKPVSNNNVPIKKNHQRQRK